MKQILLIMIGLNSLVYADFSRSTEGVVTDSQTHLQWQDNYDDMKGYYGTIKLTDWQGAIDYCEALTLDGGGWRLPNLNELASLVDDTIYKPAISSVFDYTAYKYEVGRNVYWSSTTYANRTTSAWSVEFFSGGPDESRKTNDWFVRCVRAGK